MGVSGRMGSEEERVEQEVVSKPKISEEDKGLQSMATTVEEGVRQDMVATAVRFLENDRVRASTDDMKRKFLLKKGLNEGEIREAFARVKPAAVQQPAPQQAVAVPVQVGGGHPVITVSQSSFSSRIRDLLNLLLLIGGASYGLRYLWKTYIAPWLFGPPKPVPNPQAAVVETCQAVLGGVQQLQQAITSLQTSIGSQAEKLERAVEYRQGRQENTTGDIGELKAEIQSVKGLLLSSRSFPQQPPVSAPPSLPAWQLQQNETTAPDLLAAAPTEGQRSPEASSANASSATSSANASSASEIEMLSPDSGQELSGEEGQ